MSSESVASVAISGQSAYIAACFQLTATVSRYPALLLYWVGLTPVNSVSAKLYGIRLDSARSAMLESPKSGSRSVFRYAYICTCKTREVDYLPHARSWPTGAYWNIGAFGDLGFVKLSSPMHCTNDPPRPPPPLGIAPWKVPVLIWTTGLFVSRIPLMLSDIVVIIVTWKKTFRVIRIAQDLVQRPTLSFVMLESGILYFIILLVVNLLQLTFQFLHITTTESASFVSASVLICHFILSLRAVTEQQDAHASYTANAELTYPIFTSNADSSVQYPLTLLSSSTESENDCTGDI
ncbi:hypothetical protein PYCCODRAFT_1424511 [Trametes coccinea BRFM310]|uniref:Uncharacterized protein n=1 Tax=Trametes coccinea (strain BRFM310) TaxID=1353009 RepID=A0A1Y2IT60_TRAC3|nr:hypothetical protein PYCCODRAFT_1424511 [Trametes coccinea BRFM310]